MCVCVSLESGSWLTLPTVSGGGEVVSDDVPHLAPPVFDVGVGSEGPTIDSVFAEETAVPSNDNVPRALAGI